jgi:hypothetical protein
MLHADVDHAVACVGGGLPHCRSRSITCLDSCLPLTLDLEPCERRSNLRERTSCVRVCPPMLHPLHTQLFVCMPRPSRATCLPFQTGSDRCSLSRTTLLAPTCRYFHYWFIESESDPANDPLLFWCVHVHCMQPPPTMQLHTCPLTAHQLRQLWLAH